LFYGGIIEEKQRVELCSDYKVPVRRRGWYACVCVCA